jgi:hypothetical protein
MYNLVSILGSGYVEFKNFDYGPIFSTFGYNEVEGIRIRVGGRTYFGPNDPWLQTIQLMDLMIINSNTVFQENGWSTKKQDHYFWRKQARY